MSWSSCLVNPPGEDPALLVSLTGTSTSFLLDCGDLRRLPLKELLRVRRVFVTHTHIDHFVGFDWLLRAQLFVTEPLCVYGPPGFAAQVAGKLQGYAWNLVEDSVFRVEAYELGPDRVLQQVFWCRDKFALSSSRELAWDGTLPEGMRLRWASVVHGVDCLAYRLEWPAETRVDKAALKELGRAPGAWLQELKRDPSVDPELASRLLLSIPSRALAYVTDTVWNKVSAKALIELCSGADELWCEACYLHKGLEKARHHLHMTARQAGKLACAAGVGKLHLFHFSRRYPEGVEHIAEAAEQFQGISPARTFGTSTVDC